MFDNDYQTYVLMLDNPTLYINNVRLRGYIAARSTIRGVISPYENRSRTKVRAHLIIAQTTK